MPLITIHADPEWLHSTDTRELLLAVNAAVASALGAQPDVAWSRFDPVTSDRFVVGTTGHTAPPIVVHVYANRSEAEFELIAGAVETALSGALRAGERSILITTQRFRV